MAPVAGSRATTAPFLLPRPSKAAFWALALIVVTTSPPCFSLPVSMSRVLRKNSRSSVLTRKPSSRDSSWLLPKDCEEYPVTGA